MITYSKIHRNISIELFCRELNEFVRKCSVREHIERLSETAPPIPPKVITAYKGTFQPLLRSLKSVNGLHKIDIYPTTILDDVLS